MRPNQDEYAYIESLLERAPSNSRSSVLAEVEYKGRKYPIHAIEIGPDDPTTPVIGLFGGVHGLEKIGSHVVLSYLNYLFEQFSWNKSLIQKFENVRLVSIPMVNPVGVYHNMRSNGNGVDLMRNAPIESTEKVAFLAGGQSYSNKLPWYRGDQNKLELESETLVNFVKERMYQAEFSQAIDLHSGFGIKDRLWYPYACSTKQFPDLSAVNKLSALFNKTLAHHVYVIEPQCVQYTTHGDLWDYMYDQQREQRENNVFLPWTLEMGSWIWFKKNPIQILSPHGLFNPMKDHRFSRTMRRHFLMMDFFIKATENYKGWL